MPKRETYQPGQLLQKLKEAVPRLIKEKKAELIEDFGDADDYGIEGVVVVGSVANQTEGPNSDIDLQLILSKPGYMLDFVETLADQVGRVIEWDMVELYLGEKFEQQDWNQDLEPDTERGKPYLTAFEVILSETSALRIEDIIVLLS